MGHLGDAEPRNPDPENKRRSLGDQVVGRVSEYVFRYGGFLGCGVFGVEEEDTVDVEGLYGYVFFATCTTFLAHAC